MLRVSEHAVICSTFDLLHGPIKGADWEGAYLSSLWRSMVRDLSRVLRAHSRQACSGPGPIDLIQNHLFHRLNLPTELFHSR